MEIKRNEINMEELNYPLSNLQIELLKLFAKDIESEDLLEIKKLIAGYFAQKAIKEADKVWQEGKEDEILKMHLRTKYE